METMLFLGKLGPVGREVRFPDSQCLRCLAETLLSACLHVGGEAVSRWVSTHFHMGQNYLISLRDPIFYGFPSPGACVPCCSSVLGSWEELSLQETRGSAQAPSGAFQDLKKKGQRYALFAYFQICSARRNDADYQSKKSPARFIGFNLTPPTGTSHWHFRTQVQGMDSAGSGLDPEIQMYIQLLLSKRGCAHVSCECRNIHLSYKQVKLSFSWHIDAYTSFSFGKEVGGWQNQTP